MPQPAHDLVILGGGSGGYACALRAAQLGMSVALVEAGKLGGTCLHVGCIPTKALLHAAEVADSARHAAGIGVRASFEGMDMPAVRAYTDGVVGRLHRGLQGLVSARTITYVNGYGRLVPVEGGPPAVEVDGERLNGRHVVCATGSAPRTLPGVEIGGPVMTSEEMLRIEDVPERLAVLGGGVIGVEFASAFASFGSQVTIVEALPRLLAAEDPACSKQLLRAFTKRGIRVRTGASVSSVETTGSEVRVRMESGDPVDADVLLVAVGRAPRTQDCGYHEVGLELDRGFVVTDDHCRTSVPCVFAVGDIVPGLQLAHRGFAHGIFVAETVAGLQPEVVEDRTIPRVTYCDPEVAAVGLTEDEARERYGDADSYEYNLGGNGKSQILGTSGFVKIVRAPGGPVVGVHMVGARMSEQVGEAQLMVAWEGLAEEVAALVHAHPTQNEALGEAAMALAGKALHAHA